MISITFRYPSALSAARRRVVTAVRCAGVKSPIRRPCRSNMPVGKFDHRAFCGPSNGNWTFALPASSRLETTACAAATTRAVASAGLAVVAPGFPARWADPDTAATTARPGRRSIDSRRLVLVTGGIIGAIERAFNLGVRRGSGFGTRRTAVAIQGISRIRSSSRSYRGLNADPDSFRRENRL